MYLEPLSQALRAIQDSALITHEQLEASSFDAPLLSLERRIFGPSKRVDTPVRVGILWQLLVFSKAVSRMQESFQTLLNTALEEASQRLLWRQLNTQHIKLWSYRRSLQNRGIGRTVAGPLQYQEVYFDNIIAADGAILEAEHYLGFACPVQWMQKNILVLFSEISQTQSYFASALHPYPCTPDDDAFWEEQLLVILRGIYPSTHDIRAVEHPDDEHTAYNPELRLLRLQCLLQDANKIRYSGKSRCSIRASLAQATQGEALAEVLAMFGNRRYAVDGADPSTPSVARFLASLGYLEDGQSPRAHRSSLLGDPLALLLLDSQNPVFEHVHEREPIRSALQWEAGQGLNSVQEAAARYELEQRWCASFDSLELEREEHVSILSFTALLTDIEVLFSRRLFDMPLIMAQGELGAVFLAQGLGADDKTMQDGIVFVQNMRNVKHNFELLHEAVRWILSAARSWRSIVSEVNHAQNSARLITQESRERLAGGLKDLMDLFSGAG